MRLALVARVLAVVIALAGVTDPARTASQQPMLQADLAVPRETSPDAAGTADDPEPAARAQLVTALTTATAGSTTLRVRRYGDGERLPCAADVPCVVVTDPRVVARGGFERQQPLLTLAPVLPAVAGAVTIADVLVPPAHVDEPADAVVTLAGPAPAGRATTIELYDGDVPAGSAQHTWTEVSPVTVRVPWWPSRAGRRRLTVHARTADATPLPALEVAVDVSAAALPVLVVEARPSWAVTFVRRALEADARLDVDTVSALAPGLASSRGRGGSDDERVARARVVVVGGLEGLSARDVDRYERFAAARGGAVVLVPDAAVTGAAARLLPGRWRTRIEREPSPAGGLRASEWLLASNLAADDVVLATHAGQPAVVSRALGEGRIVVVGALDAWRQRAYAPPTVEGAAPASDAPAPEAATSFTRTWQDLVTGLARGTPPPVEVRVSHTPGDGEARVDIQGRVLEPRREWRASARVRCGDDDRVVRLWPQARSGHFRGLTPLPSPGSECEVVAELAGLGEARTALAAPDRTPVEARRVIARLQQIAAGSGGAAAAPGDVVAVAARLAALRPGNPEPVVHFPMRSWWWGVAVVLLLGLEWWLRRTAGQR